MNAFKTYFHEVTLNILCLISNHGVSFIVPLDTKPFQIQIREFLGDYKIIIPYYLDVGIVHSYLVRDHKM